MKNFLNSRSHCISFSYAQVSSNSDAQVENQQVVKVCSEISALTEKLNKIFSLLHTHSNILQSLIVNQAPLESVPVQSNCIQLKNLKNCSLPVSHFSINQWTIKLLLTIFDSYFKNFSLVYCFQTCLLC